MHKRSIILSVVLFFVIVVGMFTFAYLKRTEQVQISPPEDQVIDATTSDGPLIKRVEAKHFFEDGLHTFAGIIDLPTPCHLLKAGYRVQESYPEGIVLEFSAQYTDESCIQVITPQRFKIKVAASREATVTATWDGIPIELNLIPAAPGERPEEFELFIKG